MKTMPSPRPLLGAYSETGSPDGNVPPCTGASGSPVTVSESDPVSSSVGPQAWRYAMRRQNGSVSCQVGTFEPAVPSDRSRKIAAYRGTLASSINAPDAPLRGKRYMLIVQLRLYGDVR